MIPFHDTLYISKEFICIVHKTSIPETIGNFNENLVFFLTFHATRHKLTL